jgi:hypothetical protein
MTKRTTADVDAALALLACEGGTTGSAEERAAAAVRVYARLSERLVPLIGAAGTRAIIGRSVKLARAEFACFEGVAVGVERPDAPPMPTDHQLVAALRELEPAAASEAVAALFGTLIALLTSFIGERLVSQVLRGAFPEMDESGSKETES